MSKDTEYYTGVRYIRAKGLANLKAFQNALFQETCKVNGIDPYDFIKKIEDNGLFLLSDLSKDAKLYKKVNRSGNYIEGNAPQEAIGEQVSISCKSLFHGIKLLGRLQSLGFYTCTSQLIKVTVQYYEENGGVQDEVETVGEMFDTLVDNSDSVDIRSRYYKMKEHPKLHFHNSPQFALENTKLKEFIIESVPQKYYTDAVYDLLSHMELYKKFNESITCETFSKEELVGILKNAPNLVEADEQI